MKLINFRWIVIRIVILDIFVQYKSLSHVETFNTIYVIDRRLNVRENSKRRYWWAQFLSQRSVVLHSKNNEVRKFVRVSFGKTNPTTWKRKHILDKVDDIIVIDKVEYEEVIDWFQWALKQNLPSFTSKPYAIYIRVVRVISKASCVQWVFDKYS